MEWDSIFRAENPSRSIPKPFPIDCRPSHILKIHKNMSKSMISGYLNWTHSFWSLINFPAEKHNKDYGETQKDVSIIAQRKTEQQFRKGKNQNAESVSKWSGIRFFGLRIRPNQSQIHFQSIADPPIFQKSIKICLNPCYPGTPKGFTFYGHGSTPQH